MTMPEIAPPESFFFGSESGALVGVTVKVVKASGDGKTSRTCWANAEVGPAVGYILQSSSSSVTATEPEHV